MDQKNRWIQGMFDAITPNYDLLNHVLSLGQDGYWRRRGVQALPHLKSGSYAIDLCCGTGDLTLELFYRYGQIELVGLDFSSVMLEHFHNKIEKRALSDVSRITLVQGNAEETPFDDGCADLVTCAFGIRNFSSLSCGLKESFRLLKNGGTLAVFELGIPEIPFVKKQFLPYLINLLPMIGSLISRHGYAYKYLSESIQKFPPRKEIIARLRQTGFRQVKSYSFNFGICRLYVARK